MLIIVTFCSARWGLVAKRGRTMRDQYRTCEYSSIGDIKDNCGGDRGFTEARTPRPATYLRKKPRPFRPGPVLNVVETGEGRTTPETIFDFINVTSVRLRSLVS